MVFELIKYKYKNYLFFFCSSNGIFFLNNASSGLFLGDYIFNNFLPYIFFKNFKLGSYNFLFFFDKYLYVNSICVKNKLIFAKSNGTFIYIEKIDFELKLLFLKLPSGKNLIVNFFVFGYLGRNLGYNNKFCVVSKAGLNKKILKKNNVRGVAMNPVDHPHGGRTKTNKPEVSLWGWIAKFKH